MKRIFLKPEINVWSLDLENVVTTSGLAQIDGAEFAKSALKNSGADVTSVIDVLSRILD